MTEGHSLSVLSKNKLKDVIMIFGSELYVKRL